MVYVLWASWMITIQFEVHFHCSTRYRFFISDIQLWEETLYISRNQTMDLHLIFPGSGWVSEEFWWVMENGSKWQCSTMALSEWSSSQISGVPFVFLCWLMMVFPFQSNSSHHFKIIDVWTEVLSCWPLQDPAEADKLFKIQRELDETKIILVSIVLFSWLSA